MTLVCRDLDIASEFCEVQQRVLSFLTLFAGLLGCGQTALLVCLPSLSGETNLNTAQLGSIIAVGSGMFLLGNPFWGYLSDRWSRKGALIIGTAGYAVSFALMACFIAYIDKSSSQLFSLLLGARVLYGLTASAIYPTVQAWALDVIESEGTSTADQTKALARMGASANVGRLIGPIIAAPILLIGVNWVLIFLAGVAIALSLLALSIPVYSNSQPHSPKSSRPNLNIRLLSAAALITITLGALQYSLGFLLLKYTGSTTNAGIATAVVLVAATLIVLMVQILLVKGVQNLWAKIAPIACTALVLGCATLFINHLFALLCAVVLISCAAATLAPAYQSAAAESAAEKGRTVGMFGMAHALGSSLGTWVAGMLLAKDEHTLFTVLIAASIAATLCLMPNWFRRRPHALNCS